MRLWVRGKGVTIPMSWVFFFLNANVNVNGGADPGRGGGLGVTTPTLWGNPTIHKEGKTLHACLGIYRILVLNSYLYPRLSEILHPQMLNALRLEMGMSPANSKKYAYILCDNNFRLIANAPMFTSVCWWLVLVVQTHNHSIVICKPLKSTQQTWTAIISTVITLEYNLRSMYIIMSIII